MEDMGLVTNDCYVLGLGNIDALSTGINEVHYSGEKSSLPYRVNIKLFYCSCNDLVVESV